MQSKLSSFEKKFGYPYVASAKAKAICMPERCGYPKYGKCDHAHTGQIYCIETVKSADGKIRKGARWVWYSELDANGEMVFRQPSFCPFSQHPYRKNGKPVKCVKWAKGECPLDHSGESVSLFCQLENCEDRAKCTYAHPGYGPAPYGVPPTAEPFDSTLVQSDSTLVCVHGTGCTMFADGNCRFAHFTPDEAPPRIRCLLGTAADVEHRKKCNLAHVAPRIDTEYAVAPSAVTAPAASTSSPVPAEPDDGDGSMDFSGDLVMSQEITNWADATTGANGELTIAESPAIPHPMIHDFIPVGKRGKQQQSQQIVVRKVPIMKPLMKNGITAPTMATLLKKVAAAENANTPSPSPAPVVPMPPKSAEIAKIPFNIAAASKMAKKAVVKASPKAATMVHTKDYGSKEANEMARKHAESVAELTKAHEETIAKLTSEYNAKLTELNRNFHEKSEKFQKFMAELKKKEEDAIAAFMNNPENVVA